MGCFVGNPQRILQAQSRASDQCGSSETLLEEMTPEPNLKASKHGPAGQLAAKLDSSVKTEWVLPIFQEYEHRAEERLLFLVFLPFWIFLLASLSRTVSRLS